MANASVQGAGFPHHDVEETANQNRLFGQKVLRADTEASGLLAQFTNGDDVAPCAERDGLEMTGPVILVVTTVNGTDHLLGQVPFAQQVGQVAFKQFEELVHGAVHASGGPAFRHTGADTFSMFFETFLADQFLQQVTLGVHQAPAGAQCNQLLVIKVVVFLGALCQPAQRCLVHGNACARLEFFLQGFQPVLHRCLAVLEHAQEVVDQALGDQLFLVHQDALDNQLLKLADIGSVKQVAVFPDPGHQTLFGGNGDNIMLPHAEVIGGVATHPLDCLVGVAFTLQVVPEHIDLVQDGKTTGAVIGVLSVDMLLPDGHIAGGHTGVGAEHKDDGMGPGQHADGQFRL